MFSRCCLFSAIKYYFRAEFEREVQDTDELQHTPARSARFCFPWIISATDPLDTDNIIPTLQNKTESFTSRGSGWNVKQSQSISERFVQQPVSHLFQHRPTFIRKGQF